jgi:hypothetical protein
MELNTMHLSATSFAKISTIIACLIVAVNASAACAPGDVNAEHACGDEHLDPNYKNRKNPYTSGRSGSSSSSSDDYSSGSSSQEGAARALQSIGDYLQQGSDEKEAREQAERDRQSAEYARRDQQYKIDSARNLKSFEAEASAFPENDWESRAKGNSSKRGCDCTKAIGLCKANIKILAKLKTGVDYVVNSSETSCTKVSYYIDNTPYLTVLNNSNSSIEHSSGMKEITKNSFQIEKCEICAREK